MNNSEIEMILQELLKEMQTLKSGVSKIAKSESEENGSKLSSQLDAVHKGISMLNNHIKTLARNPKIEMPKIDYTPIRRFEEKLEEFKQIQRLSPPDQIIKHQHSFKNWQWLVVLFLFIGSTFMLGWYYLDNSAQLKDVKIKYEFVRKEMPEHIKQLDSAYRSNPKWVEKYSTTIKSNFRQKKNTNNKHK